jgi:hypothetical protein
MGNSSSRTPTVLLMVAWVSEPAGYVTARSGFVE